MGAAAFTQTVDPIDLGGTNKLYIGTLTMSSSYAANGDTIDWPGDLTTVTDARVMLGPHSAYALEYDGANAKIKAGWDRIQNAAAGAFVEVTAATNLSAVSVECWAILPG